MFFVCLGRIKVEEVTKERGKLSFDFKKNGFVVLTGYMDGELQWVPLSLGER